MDHKSFHFITDEEDEPDSEASCASLDCIAEEDGCPDRGQVPALPRAKLLKDCGSLARKTGSCDATQEPTLASDHKLQALQSSSSRHTLRSLQSQCGPLSCVGSSGGGFKLLFESRVTGISAKDFGRGSFKRVNESLQLVCSQHSIASKLAQHRGDPAIEDLASSASKDAVRENPFDLRSVAAGNRHRLMSGTEFTCSNRRDGNSAKPVALHGQHVFQKSFVGRQATALGSKASDEQNATSRHSPSRQPGQRAGCLEV